MGIRFSDHESLLSHAFSLTVLGGAATDLLLKIMMEGGYRRISAMTRDIGNLFVGIP